MKKGNVGDVYDKVWHMVLNLSEVYEKEDKKLSPQIKKRNDTAGIYRWFFKSYYLNDKWVIDFVLVWAITTYSLRRKLICNDSKEWKKIVQGQWD